MADRPAIDGAFGAPPPGAPREIATGDTQSVRPTADQVAAARKNEVVLPPWTPVVRTREQMIAEIGVDAFERLEAQGLVVAAEPQEAATPASGPGPVALPAPPAQIVGRPAIGQRATSSVKPPDVPFAFKSRYRAVAVPAGHAPAAEPPEAVQEPDPNAPAPPAVIVGGPNDSQRPAHQPAASNSDTPSRGIPRPITDPGKKITGGFGDIAQAQYFPLNGDELRHLVDGLLSEIHARLEDDLRFSQAVVYPRVRARVEVIVEAYAQDGFQVFKIMPPHEKTPIEIARQYGDEVAFVVVSERVEMTDAGESVQPPDALRKELGLSIPHKHAVETPGGRMLVDV